MTKCWIGFVVYDGVKKDVPFGWKVIRWFSNDPAVHVFLAFKTDNKPAIIYETTEGAYHTEPLADRLNSPCELYPLPFDGEALEKECQKLIGTFYDYPGVSGLGFYLLLERAMNWVARYVFKLIGKNAPEGQIVFVGNPFHVQNSYFCSEAVIKAMNAAAPGFFPAWWSAESMFPKTLRNYCASKSQPVKNIE